VYITIAPANITNVKFQVLTAVVMNICVFWDTTQCVLEYRYLDTNIQVTVYLYTNMCCIVLPCTCIPTCALSCHRVPVYQHVLYHVTVYLYTDTCCIVSPCTCIQKCSVSCHRVPVYQYKLYRVTVYPYTDMCCIVVLYTCIPTCAVSCYSVPV